MSSMLALIKQAASDAVDASNPVGVFNGIVKRTEPLEVEVDQRFILTEEFLELTDSTKELRVPMGTYDYILRPKLQAGDRVYLLRVQEGQKYVVLDRVRDS